jgi:hypothetical protein
MRPSASVASVSALTLALSSTGSATPANVLFAKRADGVCPKDAVCSVQADVQRWTWTPIPLPTDAPSATKPKFVAYTVITFVNKVKGTSRTSTKWNKFSGTGAPPLTNAEGKKIHTFEAVDENGNTAVQTV